MSDIRPSSKIMLVSLITNLIGSILYLIICNWGWEFYFDNTTLFFTVTGVYVVILVPKTIMEKMMAKLLDMAIIEKERIGSLSEKSILKVSDAHYRISKYGFFLQNSAILAFFFVNEVLYSMEREITSLKKLSKQVYDSEMVLSESIGGFERLIDNIKEKTNDINANSKDQLDIVEGVKENIKGITGSVSGTHSKISQQVVLI